MERPTFCARALLAAALTVPALSCPAFEAFAQSPPAAHAAEAQERFNHGRELFLHNQFAPALAEFHASLDLYRSPNSLLYMGLCLARLGRPAEAYGALSEASALAQSSGGGRYAATGERAAHEAAALEPRIARMTVHVDHPPADLTVRVEGDVLPSEAWNHPLAREPGEVTVSAGAAGFRSFHRTLRLSAGRMEDVTVALEPDAVAVVVPTVPTVAVPTVTVPSTATVSVPVDDHPPAESTPAPGHGHGLRTAGWIVGGAGILGLVGFVVFGQMAGSRYSSVQTSCHDTHCPASYGDQIDGGVTLQTAANVSLGVGIGLLATGGTLLVISALRHHGAGAPPPDENAPRLDAWLDPTHGTLGVRGAF